METKELNILKQPFIKNGNKIKETTEKYYNYFHKKDYDKWTELRYDSFVRFLLFSWLYKYNGENKELQRVKKYLKKEVENNITQAYGTIPTNRIFYKNYIEPHVDIKLSDINKLNQLKDYDLIETIWNKRNEIFTENNIISIYKSMLKILMYADCSEKIVLNTINDFNIFPEYKATKPSRNKDKNGIDIWLIPNNEKEKYKRIQVKRLNKKTNIYTIKNSNGNAIVIENSGSLYIPCGDEIKKKIEYLVFIDNKNIYIIPTSIVKSIHKYKNKWFINLEMNTLNKYVRRIKIDRMYENLLHPNLEDYINGEL